MPGAVDRLRAESSRDEPAVQVLPAVDPVNPFGALLPWPEARGGVEAGRASRRAGASVVLVAGRPALYVEASGHRLLCFAEVGDEERERAIREGLPALARSERRRSLRIDRIDGAPARSADLAEQLTAAGFRAEYRSLVLDLPSHLPGG
jgi:ATP-dependent Lhr-like helicase